jgi:(1->4)-alpha-D-glucan 1-alpha-D-glucosylmutase
VTPQRPLCSTYRLQLNHRFMLRDARALVPYLHQLGVSHLYISPILAARPGSMHGYDVVDPLVLNPELGTEADLRALVDALHERGMGIVLDIVPNHMGTGSANRYWDDVLAYGQRSRYASWFDIDWDPPRRALRGRVLLPVLGDALDAVLARGELTLVPGDGAVRVRYGDLTFPLDPATVPETLARAGASGGGALERLAAGREGHRRLRALLDAQHYLLASWRRAAHDINYRRFFEINDLVALRMEDPAVFDATHRRILEWVADGTLDGLRVDHIDGLLDPRGYLDRLRAAVAAARPDEHDPPFPIVVEKILADGERLRVDWPVQGTTGYEFLNELEAAFVDARGKETIEARYRSMVHVGAGLEFEDVAYRGKLFELRGPLAPDVDRVCRLFRPLADRDPRTRELPDSALGEAIIQFAACLPVYRTYIDARSTTGSAEDRRVIRQALARARKRATPSTPVLDVLQDVLLAKGREAWAERLAFIQRLQQLTGPAAAKGVEDTALYRYIPLASLNEVGGGPDWPLDDAVARLHRANEERRARWPRTLLCTATHDTKRSGDVRARLDVLSEIPELWMEHATRWHRLHRPLRANVRGGWAPDVNTEYLLYQTLLGIWPLGGDDRGVILPEAPVLEALRARVDAYMRKAAREAKAQTGWTEPNPAYEAGLSAFIQRILDPGTRSPFLPELARLVAVLARAGMGNSLSRALVHLTAPGTPDLYQGDELWNFALVDPDNRQPVDFAERAGLLGELDARFDGGDAERDALFAAMMRAPEDGRLKLHVIHRALRVRCQYRELFLAGDYVPLRADGYAADHLLAFARRLGDLASLTIVRRLPLPLAGEAPLAVGYDAWRDTVLRLPAPLAGRRWACRLTGRTVEGSGRLLRLAEVFHSFPVAMLTSRES